MRPTQLNNWFQCPFYAFNPQWGEVRNHLVCHLKDMCAHTGTCPKYGYVSVSSIPLPKRLHGKWQEIKHD